MPGYPTNTQQYRLYMKLRDAGLTQVSAAVKAGISERTGRRLEQPGRDSPDEPQAPRSWRTRRDPLADVWESELLPLLQDNPELLPKTLWEYLCKRYPGQYGSKVERTLQRRIKAWKLQHGKPLEVMFLQHHEPGQQGISDFTQLKPNGVTLKGEAFAHRFYHYRLVYSGWCHVKVICGGESYEALATGLQDAWCRWVAGFLSETLGHGGTKRIAEASGLDPKTIRQGRHDLRQHLAGYPEERIRRAGGGRPPLKKAAGS